MVGGKGRTTQPNLPTRQVSFRELVRSTSKLVWAAALRLLPPVSSVSRGPGANRSLGLTRPGGPPGHVRPAAATHQNLGSAQWVVMPSRIPPVGYDSLPFWASLGISVPPRQIQLRALSLAPPSPRPRLLPFLGAPASSAHWVASGSGGR
ncbi:hypothetical protein NDU88_005566 [Pleurodeles waltl]|uniref:Uncharacterized protein n=1 Tax=Pleurodeles waltl TaxID=8319 RepID=A0AAV7MCG9_PLEWA|nr:hypothetical protein NDU88_005566 [Pleurodeles waltl]